MSHDASPTSSVSVASADAVRRTTPLVQCLTNNVVMDVTANALLAIGASPAMVDTPNESREFARLATAVLVNPGTPTAEQYQGMREAIAGAAESGTPWVLDPVACGALAERTDFIRWAATQKPTAIRGNASEISALLGSQGGRGVDATQSVADVASLAATLARETGAIVAVSGEKDLVVDPSGRATWITSGHAMMPLVIGTGCALGAIVAAYVGANRDVLFDAVVTAHAHSGVAGQLGGSTSTAPGSFKTAWIDNLFRVDTQHILAHAVLEDVAL